MEFLSLSEAVEAVRYAAQVAETVPPTTLELEVLRELHARTALAHGEQTGVAA